MRRRAILAAAAAVCLVPIVAPPAAAQFPGKPGDFVTNAYGLSTWTRDGVGPSILPLGGRLNGAGIEYPSYGPRGNAIVFDASRDGDPDYEIYRAPANGGKAVQLTHNGHTDWGAHQGPQAIAFVCDRGGDDEICTMDLDGSHVRQITFNDVSDWNPKWTPDGSRIVFSSDRHATGLDIYSMKPDGTGVRRLTRGAADELEPDVSPNGKKIVFWSEAAPTGNLVVMNIDGTHQNTLDVTAPYPSNPRTPVWSANGLRIAFGVGDQIWTRTPDDDTSTIKIAVMSGAGNNIGWQPRP